MGEKRSPGFGLILPTDVFCIHRLMINESESRASNSSVSLSTHPTSNDEDRSGGEGSLNLRFVLLRSLLIGAGAGSFRSGTYLIGLLNYVPPY